jgi:hypothetical protein
MDTSQVRNTQRKIQAEKTDWLFDTSLEHKEDDDDYCLTGKLQST